MCFVLVLHPSPTCAGERQKYELYKQNDNNVKHELPICFLTSKPARNLPTTSPSATACAGSDIESCVGGWTVGQAARCKTLLGLRQQLCSGLLQIILAVKLRSHGLIWSPVLLLLFGPIFTAAQEQIFPMTGQEFYAHVKACAVQPLCVLSVGIFSDLAFTFCFNFPLQVCRLHSCSHPKDGACAHTYINPYHR